MEDTNKVPQDIQEAAEKFMGYPKDMYDGDDWAKHDSYIQGRMDERAKQQTPNTDTVEQLAESYALQYIQEDTEEQSAHVKMAYKAGYLQRDSQGVWTDQDMEAAYIYADDDKTTLYTFRKWLEEYKKTKS